MAQIGPSESLERRQVLSAAAGLANSNSAAAEQSSNASRDLSALAAKLSRLLGQFRV